LNGWFFLLFTRNFSDKTEIFGRLYYVLVHSSPVSATPPRASSQVAASPPAVPSTPQCPEVSTAAATAATVTDLETPIHR
jgi:hypothetical protein